MTVPLHRGEPRVPRAEGERSLSPGRRPGGGRAFLDPGGLTGRDHQPSREDKSCQFFGLYCQKIQFSALESLVATVTR